jgi:inositol polyphosphate 5-phosphatase INPP5J/K
MFFGVLIWLQLNKAKQQELILIDFEEGPLNFPPTFKYDMGTNQYDTRFDT